MSPCLVFNGWLLGELCTDRQKTVNVLLTAASRRGQLRVRHPLEQLGIDVQLGLLGIV